MPGYGAKQMTFRLVSIITILAGNRQDAKFPGFIAKSAMVRATPISCHAPALSGFAFWQIGSIIMVMTET